MAENEKIEVQKITASQITSTGLNAVSGVISDPYSNYTYAEKLELYSEMRRDPIINTSLELIINPILTADYTWEAKQTNTENTQKIINYLDWTFKNLYNGFYGFKRHWALKYVYGLSLFEPVFDTLATYQGQKTWQLVKISPIMLKTISKWHYDDFGNFLGIQQQYQGSNSGNTKEIDVWIPVLWYDNNNEEFGNIQGISVLEPIITAYQIKKKLLIADTRASERGAGIPVGTLNLDKITDASVKTNMEDNLRTIGNSKGAFFLETSGTDSNGANYEISKIRFEGLKDVQNNQAKIEYQDKVIFYNTQTHFVLSGVSDTGSRAAAESQKSPFVSRVNQELKIFDERLNDLIDRIIQYSPYASVNQNEWARYKSKLIGIETVEAIKEKVIETAAELNIKKDDKILNKCYGHNHITLAKKQDEKIIIDDVSKKEKEKNEIKLQFEDYDFTRMSETAKNIFSIELAAENYDSIGIKASNLITDIYIKAITELAEKLEKNPKAEIKLPRFQELLAKLKGLYRTAYENGIQSFKEELAKIKSLKMAAESEPIIKYQIGDDIFTALSSLYDATAAGINQFLKNNNQVSIEKMGGLKKAIIDNFADGQIQLRNSLAGTVANGFYSGRAEVLLDNEEDIELLEYTAIMDKGTCAECAPLDGVQQSAQEWIETGLNIDPKATVLNPNCIGLKGNNKCRCQLIPVKVAK